MGIAITKFNYIIDIQWVFSCSYDREKLYNVSILFFKENTIGFKEIIQKYNIEALKIVLV